jgi:hypothetical protein
MISILHKPTELRTTHDIESIVKQVANMKFAKKRKLKERDLKEIVQVMALESFPSR